MCQREEEEKRCNKGRKRGRRENERWDRRSEENRKGIKKMG